MVLWVKAAHIISVIAWMAALLYLPRLFVYHCEAETGSPMSEKLKIMERRLMKAIMTPAMIATWVFGLWAASLLHVWSDVWFLIKLLCVVVITGMHMANAKWLRSFANDTNTNSQKFYRIANEVPAALMIVIVIMVVVKPF